MNKIFSIYLITSLSLLSCNHKVEANFEISNHTPSEIDSLKIEPMTSNNGKYISLKKDETVTYKAEMSEIPKIDGSYRLTYFSQGEQKTKDFGYYSNGYPQEKLTKMKIETDTILIEQIFD